MPFPWHTANRALRTLAQVGPQVAASATWLWSLAHPEPRCAFLSLSSLAFAPPFKVILNGSRAVPYWLTMDASAAGGSVVTMMGGNTLEPRFPTPCAMETFSISHMTFKRSSGHLCR